MLRICLILKRIRILEIFFNKIRSFKLFSFFRLFLCLDYKPYKGKKNCNNRSIFISSDLGFESVKFFFPPVFFVDNLPPVPDPWIQNVADSMDPDSKHFLKYFYSKNKHKHLFQVLGRENRCIMRCAQNYLEV